MQAQHCPSRLRATWSFFFSLSLPSFSLSLFVSVSSRLTLSLLNKHDNDHSFSRLSLYAQITLVQNTSVHGPRSIRGFWRNVRTTQEESLGFPGLASCRLVSSGPVPALMEKRCDSLLSSVCCVLGCCVGLNFTAGKEVCVCVLLSVDV